MTRIHDKSLARTICQVAFGRDIDDSYMHIDVSTNDSHVRVKAIYIDHGCHEVSYRDESECAEIEKLLSEGV